MKTEIIERKGYDYVRAFIEPEEEIYAQPGSLMYMNGDVRIETKSFGGIFKGIKRSLFGGETFFINRFIAISNAELWFSPSYPGEILEIPLNGEELFVRDGAYLLNTGNIEIDTKFFGLKGIFSRGGLFWLKLRGYGSAYLNVYGAIEEIKLDGGSVLVDNYNLVAFDSSLDVKLRKIGGLKTFFFGGEGFLFEISGNGRVYLQTRSLPQLAAEIYKCRYR